MALIPVADDHVAAVVTRLEMPRRPPLRPGPDSRLRLIAWERPSPARYRALFARIGTPWLWYSRLTMVEDRLLAIIHDPGIAIYAVADPSGIEVGMLELDHREPGACELSYFGLVPELAGQGHGRWLMAQALALAWRRETRSVWVHTCTLDHPSALNFYRAQGFVAVARTVETFPDPRTLGVLPEDAAPQVPLLAKRR